jgi:hypothetical protein
MNTLLVGGKQLANSNWQLAKAKPTADQRGFTQRSHDSDKIIRALPIK